jgi:hypothetical protein
MSNCCSDVALARDDDPSDNVLSRAKASPLGWKLVPHMEAEAAALGKLAIATEGRLSNGNRQPYSSTCEWHCQLKCSQLTGLNAATIESLGAQTCEGKQKPQGFKLDLTKILTNQTMTSVTRLILDVVTIAYLALL